MLEEHVVRTRANTASSYFNDYDAGTETVTTEYGEIELAAQVQQLFFYPKVDCFVKINGSTKEIFVPKDIWTPILLRVDSILIKASTTGGTVYWQGWSL